MAAASGLAQAAADCDAELIVLCGVGEVACNGVHGANRLASNSLLEGVVRRRCDDMPHAATACCGNGRGAG